MSARRPFLSATLAKATASKRSSIRLIGPTVPSPGTKSTSRSPAPKASPTSSRERQLADTPSCLSFDKPQTKTSLASYSPARDRDGFTPVGCGYCRHRALAEPRKHRNNQCLRACRSCDEGKGAWKGPADGYTIPTIPCRRPLVGV